MSTIRDVARLAGVSTATVSRVINGTGFVTEELRERVMAAMAEHNYQPNNLARSFRQNRSFMVALMISDISNPFFTSLVRGVEDVVNERGLNLILCNTDEDPGKELSYAKVLISNRIDGVIMAPTKGGAECAELFTASSIAVVFIDRYLATVRTDAVLIDNSQGAYEATSHLISHGHRRIGIITGLEDVSTSLEREAGYRRALRDSGLEVDTSIIARGNSRIDGGFNQTKRLMSLPPDTRPTSLFTTNNLLTIGALLALKDMGLRVPRDIALVGFDDFESTAVVEPPLTVVAQPTYEIGRTAADYLFRRMAGGMSSDAPAHVRLMPRMITRESCGCSNELTPRSGAIEGSLGLPGGDSREQNTARDKTLRLI